MSATDNALSRLRGAVHNQVRDFLRTPLIQAPMAGVATPQLAQAAMAAGAIGSLGVGGTSAEKIATLLDRQRELGAPSAHLNFFVHPRAQAARERELRWLEQLTPLFDELGVPAPTELSAPYPTFDDNPQLLELLLDQAVPLVSFHFGLPANAAIKALGRRGTTIMASATNPHEAQTLAAAGVDIIVAQGWEAGGHRSHFDTQPDTQLSTTKLVELLVRQCDCPIIAAGGISGPDDVQTMLALGASGVQVGTAFIPCPESAASPSHRIALADAAPVTQMTASFSGRPARALVNRYVQLLDPVVAQAPNYPITYAAHRALMAAVQQAAASQDPAAATHGDLAALWAGTGAGKSPVMPAAELVGWLMQ